VDSFSVLKSIGFDLFQGYYFAKPVEQKSYSARTNRLKILELISLIDEGKSPAELEESLKQDAELTIELLRFINSPYFMIKNEIDSVKKAILMIGITRFKQWLFLLLYASGSEDLARNPLFQLVLQRARIMSELARSLEGADREKAFLTGVLSAADVLMKMPMRELLERFKIDREVKEALLERKNRYGKLLTLVMANELGHQKVVEKLLEELGLRAEVFAEAISATI
jgi:EAL and modified HD-GYP domain-containing signal transduction protein